MKHPGERIKYRSPFSNPFPFVSLLSTPAERVGLFSKEVKFGMYTPVENTAYCLNCTNEWPAIWKIESEPTIVCPKCHWRLGMPIEFVSSGWWTTQESEGYGILRQ